MPSWTRRFFVRPRRETSEPGLPTPCGWCVIGLGQVGVKTLFIEPGSPWENGYIESFNGKLCDERLNRESFETLLAARELIERRREHDNTVRQHSDQGYRPQRGRRSLQGRPTLRSSWPCSDSPSPRALTPCGPNEGVRSREASESRVLHRPPGLKVSDQFAGSIGASPAGVTPWIGSIGMSSVLGLSGARSRIAAMDA